jgi:hypothetical protein
LHHFIKKTKNYFPITCYFYLSAFSFARMATPKNTKLCHLLALIIVILSALLLRHLLLLQIFMRLSLLY